MENAFLALLGNIQGLDAALVVLCLVMYKIITHSRKDDAKDVLWGIVGITVIGLTLIFARIWIS